MFKIINSAKINKLKIKQLEYFSFFIYNLIIIILYFNKSQKTFDSNF